MKVSTFQSSTRPCFYIESAPKESQYVHFSFKNVELEKILEAIRKGSYKKQIAHVRTLPGGYEANKKRLPCFTPSGTFRIRNDWDLLDYNKVVQLDYDKLSNDSEQEVQRAYAENLRFRLSHSPYCLSTFVSPSGHGVKVFVRVSTSADLHLIAWSQVRAMMDELAGVKSDPTVRNISRLCFVSVDPDLYYNPDSKVFEVNPEKIASVTVPDASILSSDTTSLFGWLFNLTQKGKYQGEVLAGYTKSGRNNFLYVYACNCNRYGIEKSVALDFVKQIWIADNMGFPVSELTRTVDSAYSHKHEFGSLRLPQKLRS